MCIFPGLTTTDSRPHINDACVLDLISKFVWRIAKALPWVWLESIVGAFETG